MFTNPAMYSALLRQKQRSRHSNVAAMWASQSPPEALYHDAAGPSYISIMHTVILAHAGSRDCRAQATHACIHLQPTCSCKHDLLALAS